jgi:hypothetical protein
METFNRTWTQNSNHAKNLDFKCDDLVKYKNACEVQNEYKSEYYGNYVLEWIRDWPSQDRDRIFIDSIISNKGEFLLVAGLFAIRNYFAPMFQRKTRVFTM